MSLLGELIDGIAEEFGIECHAGDPRTANMSQEERDARSAKARLLMAKWLREHPIEFPEEPNK